MKKVIFVFVALIATVISVNAQNQTNYTGSSKFFDNWSIGLNGGVQTNLNDWRAPQGAVATLEFNKEITPIVGITAEIGTGINNRCNWYSNTSHMCNGVIFDQLTAFIDGRINLTNAICGYKGSRRFFEVETVTGIGYGHGYAAGGDNGTDALLVKGGFKFNFNLSDAFTINVTPAIIYNVSQTGQFDVRYAVGQITAGVVYHFQTSNGTRHFVKAQLYNQNDIDALNAKIDELNKANAALKNTPKPRPETKVVNVEVTKERAINFDQNSSVLSDDAKAILDTFKSGMTVNVFGSTSPEGTSTRNTQLAQERADAVANYLSGREIKVNKAIGGESGRVAIIQIVK